MNEFISGNSLVEIEVNSGSKSLVKDYEEFINLVNLLSVKAPNISRVFEVLVSEEDLLALEEDYKRRLRKAAQEQKALQEELRLSKADALHRQQEMEDDFERRQRELQNELRLSKADALHRQQEMEDDFERRQRELQNELRLLQERSQQIRSHAHSREQILSGNLQRLEGTLLQTQNERQYIQEQYDMLLEDYNIDQTLILEQKASIEMFLKKLDEAELGRVELSHELSSRAQQEMDQLKETFHRRELSRQMHILRLTQALSNFSNSSSATVGSSPPDSFLSDDFEVTIRELFKEGGFVFIDDTGRLES